MRLKIKNTTYFGEYLGKDKKGKVIFLDEETNKIIKLDKKKVVKAYDKWR
tara:strand:- start:3949 stop:4098 length:150 start_codon:yes stop_codon:yes gene_type:complete